MRVHRIIEHPMFHCTHRLRAIIVFVIVSIVAVFSAIRINRAVQHHEIKDLLKHLTKGQRSNSRIAAGAMVPSSRKLRGLNVARVIVGFDEPTLTAIRESIPSAYLPYLRQQYPHLRAALFCIPLTDTVPSVDSLLSEFSQLPGVV
jgi:hypothetical protein